MPSIPNKLISEINLYSDIKTAFALTMLTKIDYPYRRRQLWTLQNSIGPLLELLPARVWKSISPHKPLSHQCRHCKQLKAKEFDRDAAAFDNGTRQLLVSLGDQMEQLVIPTQNRCYFIADIAEGALEFLHNQFDCPLLSINSIECWKTNEDQFNGCCYASQSYSFLQNIMKTCQPERLIRFDMPYISPNTNNRTGEMLRMLGYNLQELCITFQSRPTVLGENASTWINLTKLCLVADVLDSSLVYQNIAPLSSLQYIRLDVHLYSSRAHPLSTNLSFPNLRI
ncbi:hypothetical protein CPB83DRAFT_898759 [Crepidotus variabilis]|uniref:Uncharacterized protein n=1 Tax=Crepidotus variabilis TaxID=179855 RepID=A0A9P6E6I6_9AGAR|nr:hypothetical protein CPB83DRAFT_898759 [Crepidotus variabilis]